MAAEIVELDRKKEDMTVEETLARAQRLGFKHVVVVGLCQDDVIDVWYSGENQPLNFWLLSKATSAILGSS